MLHYTLIRVLFAELEKIKYVWVKSVNIWVKSMNFCVKSMNFWVKSINFWVKSMNFWVNSIKRMKKKMPFDFQYFRFSTRGAPQV